MSTFTKVLLATDLSPQADLLMPRYGNGSGFGSRL